MENIGENNEKDIYTCLRNGREGRRLGPWDEVGCEESGNGLREKDAVELEGQEPVT